MDTIPIAARGSACRPRIICAGKLLIDMEKKVVEYAGERVHLVPMEYLLLERLSQTKGRSVTKKQLRDHIYGAARTPPKTNTIEAFVSKLRSKLKNASEGIDFIGSVIHVGYALLDPPLPD